MCEEAKTLPTVEEQPQNWIHHYERYTYEQSHDPLLI